MLNQYNVTTKTSAENNKTSSEHPKITLIGVILKEPGASVEKYSKDFGTPVYQDPTGAFWTVPFYSVAYDITMVNPNEASSTCCGCADEIGYVFDGNNVSFSSDMLIKSYQDMLEFINQKQITEVSISIKKLNNDPKVFTAIDTFKNYLIAEFGAEALNKKPESTYQMER